MMPRLTLGVSSCLLGNSVRYDGAAKEERYITEHLSRFFTLLSICPETEIGLPVPRPPIQLTGNPDQPQARGVADPSFNPTARLQTHATRCAEELAGISGFIFKQNSPSCGLHGVKVFTNPDEPPLLTGQGIFANGLTQRYPLLPVIEETDLDNMQQRENFINRCHVWQRWQALIMSGITAKDLIQFHAAHKYMVMAHSPEGYQASGRLLADFSDVTVDAIAVLYIARLMKTLKEIATREGNANVLEHILGYLKKNIDKKTKRNTLAVIHAYRQGEIPLSTPINQLNQHFLKQPNPYITRQYYLHPYPEALGLRDNIY